ncbi:mechanosensitive ion channel family protein [Jannaschia formosa]|uniref:mechanosensitive ion channel family protein n=1 Tax=Jannaschia formosa TaxID=2259592 RepID=UPI001431BC28|nr:mechanosensitive ion channel family protein [Jannaschia formosa]
MFDDLSLPDLPIDLADLAKFDLLASLILLVVLLAARGIVTGTIRARADLAPQVQRRWLATGRNLFLFIFLVGLVLIWAPQLRTLALSLTAVAVAIVVATKELILCLSGAVLRASTRAFSVGDLIEVGALRGEVADHTLLATTLHEYGSDAHAYMPTGPVVTVPNSALLTSPVRNLTALREHVYHRFVVTVEATPGTLRARGTIREIVARHYEPVRAAAAQANERLERRTRADLPDPAPEVRFRTTDLGKLRVEITLYCPPARAVALEQEITEEMLDLVADAGQTPSADAPPAPEAT